MSYVRSKSIKGHTYYYLVSSKRINGHVVQKFEKYYGKTQEPKEKIEKTESGLEKKQVQENA